MRAPTKIWTTADDALLRKLHGDLSIEEIAAALGRSAPSVRGRITRIGIAKLPFWTQAQIQELVELYTTAGADGVLGLSAFGAKIGKDPKNISRKAKELGLPTNLRRRVVEQRKNSGPKFANDDDRRASMSELAKARIKERGHPRGMRGKKHSDETRQLLSRSGKAAYLALPPEEKADRVTRAMKTRAASGWTAPRVERGSWKAGWREIGGKRNYYRSRWEANYGRYLQWLKERGQIIDWQHEPETFWFEAIRRGARSYLPDFRVWELDGSTALHEVKGWMDQRSRTVLKRMAKYHPDQRVIVIDGRQYRAIRLKVMRLVPGWEDAKRDAHV